MRSLLSALFLALSLTLPVTAALKSASVTEVHGNVLRGNLKPPADETAAQAKTRLDLHQYLRTGLSSRAELVFNDETMARLGANSIFQFSPNKSNLVLEKGEGLFVIPKGQSGATITTPALSAAILGTTVYVKMDPRAVQYYCLEGKCKIGPHILVPGEALILRGKMGVYGAPKSSFKIASFMKSAALVNNFKTALPSKALVEAEATKQK